MRFRVRLVGEYRLGAARSRADLELEVQRTGEWGRFDGSALLICDALGGRRRALVTIRLGPALRALYAVSSREAALELQLDDGSRVALVQDAEAPLGLLRASSFVGHVSPGEGELRLRFDLRHDLGTLLRQAWLR